MESVTDWGQAWRIVGGGLVAVFVIMTLLATATHVMGKIFQSVEKSKKEKAKQAEAKSGEASA